jgi:hypothetical protein
MHKLLRDSEACVESVPHGLLGCRLRSWFFRGGTHQTGRCWRRASPYGLDRDDAGIIAPVLNDIPIIRPSNPVFNFFDGVAL